MKQPSHFLLFCVKRLCLFDGCECFTQRWCNRKFQTFRLLFAWGSLQKLCWEWVLILLRQFAHIQPYPFKWLFLFWVRETLQDYIEDPNLCWRPRFLRVDGMAMQIRDSELISWRFSICRQHRLRGCFINQRLYKAGWVLQPGVSRSLDSIQIPQHSLGII